MSTSLPFKPARLHRDCKRDLRRLENFLSVREIEHILMSHPKDAKHLIVRYQDSIDSCHAYSKKKRKRGRAALKRSAERRPQYPPLQAVLSPEYYNALKRQCGISAIASLEQVGDQIKSLRLHPHIQKAMLSSARALADSPAMA